MTTITGYPFVKWVDQEARPVIENAEERLKQIYNDKFHPSVILMRGRGIEHIQGYSFDYRPLLKHYVYCRYGEWHGAYAPNRAALRKSICGRIGKILENK
jgi:hypothetical protein